MRAIGSMIKLTGKAHIFIWMERGTKGIGEKTNSMDLELRPGLIMLGTRVTMNLARNMELEHSDGQITLCILENFTITTYMEREFTHGLMDVNTRENGVIIRCMVKAPLLGLMAESMLESMQMTKNTAMENSFGQILAATKEIGKMGNKMVKEFILRVRAKKNMENGKKEKE